MLEELNILNGKLDLKFDKYNNIYTVEVEESVNSLELEYIASDGYKVSVNNNFLNNELNYVYLNVYNENETNTYTLIVTKKISETTSLIEDYKKSVMVEEMKVPTYQVAFIISGCFIVLLITFFLLFHKKKRKR